MERHLDRRFLESPEFRLLTGVDMELASERELALGSQSELVLAMA